MAKKLKILPFVSNRLIVLVSKNQQWEILGSVTNRDKSSKTYGWHDKSGSICTVRVMILYGNNDTPTSVTVSVDMTRNSTRTDSIGTTQPVISESEANEAIKKFLKKLPQQFIP